MKEEARFKKDEACLFGFVLFSFFSQFLHVREIYLIIIFPLFFEI